MLWERHSARVIFGAKPELGLAFMAKTSTDLRCHMLAAPTLSTPRFPTGSRELSSLRPLGQQSLCTAAPIEIFQKAGSGFPERG